MANVGGEEGEGGGGGGGNRLRLTSLHLRKHFSVYGRRDRTLNYPRGALNQVKSDRNLAVNYWSEEWWWGEVKIRGWLPTPRGAHSIRAKLRLSLCLVRVRAPPSRSFVELSPPTLICPASKREREREKTKLEFPKCAVVSIR